MRSLAETLRFAVVADIHYKEGMYIASVADMEQILRVAVEENAQFIIASDQPPGCVGDGRRFDRRWLCRLLPF